MMDYVKYLLDFLFTAVSFLHTYGWYILVMGIAGLYIWNKWLKEKYNNWRIEREEREYDARYHKSKFVFVKLI